MKRLFTILVAGVYANVFANASPISQKDCDNLKSQLYKEINIPNLWGEHGIITGIIVPGKVISGARTDGYFDRVGIYEGHGPGGIDDRNDRHDYDPKLMFKAVNGNKCIYTIGNKYLRSSDNLNHNSEKLLEVPYVYNNDLDKAQKYTHLINTFKHRFITLKLKNRNEYSKKQNGSYKCLINL